LPQEASFLVTQRKKLSLALEEQPSELT